MTGLRASLLSDQGAFFADAQPTKVKAGLFHIVTGSYDIRPRTSSPTATTRTRRPAASRIAARSASPRPRTSSSVSSTTPRTSSAWTRRSSGSTTSSSRTSSRTSRRRAFSTTRATTRRRCGSRSRSSGTSSFARAGGRPRRRAAARDRLASFTEVLGAGKGKDYDIAGLRMFDSAELRVHPTGKAILKLGVRTQGQVTRPRSPRSWPASSASPTTTSRCRRAIPTTPPTGSARTRAADPRRRGGDGGDRPQASGQGQGDRRPPARGLGEGHRVRGGASS